MRVQTLEVAQIEGKPKAKTLPSLETLYEQHKGLAADKWSSYLREYDRVFFDFRERPIRLLEIGVQNGGSLEIWARYFAHAQKLVGCDIDPKCGELRYEDPRVALIIGDASAPEAYGRIVAQSPEFDVVIDDGSHRSSDIVKMFAHYFPLLADGGVFVVEDLHCSYWQEYEGGLFHPYSAMTFLKRLADVVNHEHWGVPRYRSDLLRGVGDHYGVQFHDQDLARIHSVEFSNSLCVIRKAPTDDNLLGSRSTVGSLEPVAEGKLALRGMRWPDHQDQSTNDWANRAGPAEDELMRKDAEWSAAQASLAKSERELEEARAQLLEASASVQAKEGLIEEFRTNLAGLSEKLVDQSEERLRWRAVVTEREGQLFRAVQDGKELRESLTRLEAERHAAVRAHDAARQNARKVEAELKSAREELKGVKASVSWRVTSPLRVANRLGPPGGYGLAVRRARKVLREKGVGGATKRMFELMTGQGRLGGVPKKVSAPKRPAAVPAVPRNTYAEWLKQFDTLKAEGRAALLARTRAFVRKPLVSVVLVTHEPNLQWIVETIESVREQVYPHWELCIVDNASSNPAVRPMLEGWADRDPRVRICALSSLVTKADAANHALGIAAGEFVAFVEQDDVLREQAFFRVVEALNSQREIEFIYSDEDKIGARGERTDPHFKCDWNPDLILSQNYCSHLCVYSAALLKRVGGLRSGFEGAEHYDLVLRSAEALEPTQIHHLPRVLYSKRTAERQASASGTFESGVVSGQRALQEHFQRCGVAARSEITLAGSYRARYQLPPDAPMVSLIVPTRNALKLVRQCMESVFTRTTYSAFEVLLVDNGSDDPAALAYFHELTKRYGVRVLRDDRPFNYSALNNMAVDLAKGEFVCLLNNDIEVISPYWLDEMVGIGLQPGVGAVGARLWYPNDTLQHGGVILGVHGIGGHAHKLLPKGSRGYHGRADVIQSLSAVTAACLLVRRSTYLELGGLNETELQVAFNDVDFCLRLREAGYRNVWTPYANLYHHESATRGSEDSPEKVARFEREVRYMKLRWAAELIHDPAYNPNLSFSHEDFSLAWPPRLALSGTSVS